MTEHHPISGAAIGLPAYISNVQDEACALQAVLEGLEILLEEGDRARNSATALIAIALEKAGQIFSALDTVNLPKT